MLTYLNKLMNKYYNHHHHQVRKGRSTVIVAHRLSTIRSADKIIAFHQGVVAEEGTHKELMKRKSFYYNLVTAQISPSERNKCES